MANAQRSRALTLSKYAYFDHNAGVARKLRSKQNQLFGQVAISPTPDLAPPKPVMQNVGAQLFLGLAGAGFDAAEHITLINPNNNYRLISIPRRNV